jgi:AcrR family transcriptional regulator
MPTQTTRDRLIDAASDLFYEHGFHSVGLDQIIDQVGVTKTTFYNHFESKDALIIEVLRHRDEIETAELLASMRERAGDDPRGQLIVLFDVLHDWFNGASFRGCIFMNAAVAFPIPNDPVHIAAAAHGASLFTAIRAIAEKAGADDPDLIANQILMLISGSLVARHVSNDSAAAKTARTAAEMLLERHLGPVAHSR